MFLLFHLRNLSLYKFEVYYTILTVSKHFNGNIHNVFIALSPTILEASVQLLFFLDVTYITRDLPP